MLNNWGGDNLVTEGELKSRIRIMKIEIDKVMKRKYIGIVVLIILFAFTNCTNTDSIEFKLEIEPANYSSNEVPVHVEVKLPSKLQKIPVEQLSVTLKSDDDEFRNVPGQIIETMNGKYELWWILPITNVNEPVQWTATLTYANIPSKPTFNWEDTPDKHLDLFFDEKRVFRYDYELDNLFEKGKTLTALNKPFYHIYDLLGQNKITNGPEEGVWSHHRGIMIGWRNVGFKEENLSFWGMEDLTVQKHIEFKKSIAGPVLAQTEALIQWNDSSGNIIIEERRKATIYRQSPPAILLMDFTSNLKTVNGPVTLDGNADHGGVQFRAHNDVAEGALGAKKATYFFHQDSIDPIKDYNLPWVAMSYGLNYKTYSILQMDNPDNPGQNIWSAYRDYGRFGPFFQKNLDANETLTIQYRFWISESDMPNRAVLSSKHTTYIEPLKIQIMSP
jgi:hypothetical protein